MQGLPYVCLVRSVLMHYSSPVFYRVEYCLRFTCGEREGLQGCGWGYRTNKQWLPHHSGLDTTLTSNPLSSKVWEVSSFWKVHYFCRIHSEQQMICENKAIVFTFYSPPHPKLLGFPTELFEKLLKEEFSSPSRVIHRHAKNILASVTFSKGHTCRCPGVCDGHGALGTTSHLLLFLDTFYHESVCKAPSTDIQRSVLQNGGPFLFPVRFVDLRRYFKGAQQECKHSRHGHRTLQAWEAMNCARGESALEKGVGRKSPVQWTLEEV